MDKSNDQVRQMFDLASKEVNPQKPITKVMLIPKQMQAEMLKQQADQAAQAQGAPSSGQVDAKATGGPVYAEPAPMDAAAPQQAGAQASGAFVEAYAKNASAMMSLLSNYQQRQEQQLAQFMVPMERIQRLYYQTEQDRKTFINQLDGRFKSVLGDISLQQRFVIYGFVFGLALLGLVVWGFLMIVGRMRSRREEVIMKYQQEMLRMVRDMAALPGANPYAALPPTAGAYRLAGTAPAQLTANPAAMGTTAQVTVMDVDNSRPNPVSELEAKTLSGNYKERALAAMQMLNLDAERAVEVIKRMLTDPDPFQRECMAAMLGEQFHPLTLELLLEGLKDNEDRVVAAAVRAARKWEQLPEEIYPLEAKEKMKAAVKSTALARKKAGGKSA
jgi:hypothetical protein